MHPDVRRRIESYVFTICPATLLLMARWLENGSDLNEIDYTRAKWAQAEYKRYKYMDQLWEPKVVTMTENMAGMLLEEIEARLEAIDSQMHTYDPWSDDYDRLLRERSRLLADHRALLRV